VGVQHDGVAGDAVHRCVDEHRGRLDAVAPFEHRAVGIDSDDVAWPHLAPVQAARVDQEARRFVG
jgi:hypothetical protein